MSWKSFVSAGLVCILASPVFAIGPTLRVVNGPSLDANGNWVWNVSVETGVANSPVGAELGFSTNRAVVGTPSVGPLFDTENPGTSIFTWNVAEDSGFPEGLEVEPIGNDGTINEIFAALGSDILADSPAQNAMLTIVTTGPSNTALTGQVTVLGAYGSNEGRIAQLDAAGAAGDCAVDSCNYDGYVGTASRTIVNGDINLSGVADDSDFAIFVGQYDPSTGGKTGNWTIGDFNRDGFVDDSDFAIFVGQYNPGGSPGGSTSNLAVTGTVAGGGSAPGLAVAVPEPASLALLALAVLGGGLGVFRNRR